MLKKFLFGIAFIAIAAIAAINMGISSKKNLSVDLKNANKEALASTEGGFGWGSKCDASEQWGPYLNATGGIICKYCVQALYIPTNYFMFCVY